MHETVLFFLYLVSVSLLINLGTKTGGFSTGDPWLYVTWVLSAIVIFFDVALILIEILHAMTQGRGYVLDYWNYPDWVCNLAIIYFAAVLIGRANIFWDATQRQLFGVCVLYLWLKCLEYAGTYKTTSAVSRLFLMMLRTLLQYLVVLLIFVLAFGHAMFLAAVNLQDSDNNDYQNTGMMVIRMYRALMGDDLPFGDLIQRSDNQPYSILGICVLFFLKVFFSAPILYFAFTISGILLLLNLLIALMTKVFDEVKESIETTFYLNRFLSFWFS